MIEPWLIALISGAGSGLLAAIGFGYWFGRNTPTTTDMQTTARVLYDKINALETELRGEVKLLEVVQQTDRHSARSNMDQRTMQFQEKVEEARDRYDIAIEKNHLVDLRVTRLEAKINGGPIK